MNDFASGAMELTAMEQDTLAEISNISMGSAATALSALGTARFASLYLK